MPGRYDGPADAYRHGLLAAELTRKYGRHEARKILNAHEWTGNIGGQEAEAEAMDNQPLQYPLNHYVSVTGTLR